ncbi:LuxR C-terminal-related transcriptional regulator [Kosakonia sp. H02]|nr:LuxR C-terminal-related transcriptional regulator [Kosakonia sp. H02]
MKIYTISDDVYFQNGIISLANAKGWNIEAHELTPLFLEELTLDDIVILHLDKKNMAYAKAISHLNKVSKLLVILGATRNIIIDKADIVIKAQDSLSQISQAIKKLQKMEKEATHKENALSDIERIILNESLKGKSIHLIAKLLSISPKRVYAYRNKACKKMGGKKINDLLLIKDNLLEDTVSFISPSLHI